MTLEELQLRKIFFWSDTHFNHTKIIEYCGRPYKNVTEMNEFLISNWNARVSDTDDIYLVGDFAFRGELPLLELFHRLRGRKHLIVGNHDEKNPEVLRLPWLTIDRLFTLKFMKMRVELCHYPIESWKSKANGALMVHGHCHGTLKNQMNRRFDVGADVETEPVSLFELLRRCSPIPDAPVDHHVEL